MDKEAKIGNPARFYPDIEALDKDTMLNEKEKLQAMENWRDDILLKLKATEENMDGKDADLEALAALNERLPHQQ